MSARRVGVPMTDRILEFLEQRQPGLKSQVWKIFYPMRETEPIEVSVRPGALGGSTLELQLEGMTLLVREEAVLERGTRPERGL